jgi:hypothetical protein
MTAEELLVNSVDRDLLVPRGNETVEDKVVLGFTDSDPAVRVSSVTVVEVNFSACVVDAEEADTAGITLTGDREDRPVTFEIKRLFEIQFQIFDVHGTRSLYNPAEAPARVCSLEVGIARALPARILLTS